MIGLMLRGVDGSTASAFFISFLSGIFTTLLTWLEVYSGEIGAACTILSLFCMIFFGINNGRKLDKSTENSRISAQNSETSTRNSENIEKLTKLVSSKFTHLEQTIKKGDSNEKRKAKK